MDAAHPIGIAMGKIVVQGHDVNAFACERVQVTREGGYERFAFAGFHFGDAAAVERDAADQLDRLISIRQEPIGQGLGQVSE